MKKEIIINNQIIWNLSQNSVQENNFDDFFWYNKILDEKWFYDKDWTLNINKVLIYKEYLKYEYLEELEKINILNRKIFKDFSWNKNLKYFLEVKNELKYICDLLEKNWKLEVFNFWFDFNKNWFDKNDKFFYQNRKNIDEIDWKDIYIIRNKILLEKIFSILEKTSDLSFSYIEKVLNNLIKNVNDLDLWKKIEKNLINYFTEKDYITWWESKILFYKKISEQSYKNKKNNFFAKIEKEENNEEKINILVSLMSYYISGIDIKKDFWKYIDEILIINKEYWDIFDIIYILIEKGFYNYKYFNKKLSKYFKFDDYYGLFYIKFLNLERWQIWKLYNIIEKWFLKWIKGNSKIWYLWFILPEILNNKIIWQKFWNKNNEIIIKSLNNTIIKETTWEYELRDFDEALYSIFEIPVFWEKIYNLIKKEYIKNILKYKFSFTKILNFESEDLIDKYIDIFIKNDKFPYYIIEVFKNIKTENLYNKYLPYLLYNDILLQKNFLESKKISFELKKKLVNNIFKNIIFHPHKQKINSFIKNSDSGSFLLSGYRWVWKTSLLKKSFDEFNKNNDEKVIPVFVNIPEPDKEKGFCKKQLMNFIIRNLYKQVLLNPWKFPKSFERKLEDQYIRTFKDVKNIEWDLVVRKRGILKIILAVLQYWLPFWIAIILFLYWNISQEYLISIFWNEHKEIIEKIVKNFDLIKLITAFLIFIIWYKLSFSFINVTFKSKIAQDLYDENIAEQQLTDNLWSYNNYLETFWFRIWNFIFSKPYTYLADKLNLIFSGFFIIPFLILILLSIFLVILILIFKLIIILPFLKYIFWTFILWFFYLGVIYFLKKYFSRPKHKFVIVIDELDKLLDFEEKSKVNMESVFDILWKLKILFFDTKGLLFFVVANKEAYDYHLKDKYREDDLVSNIFNRILYLPMNKKEKFNLNFSVLWEWENKFNSEELYSFNKWLYFKSHWNWRKMRFILNEKLDNNWENNILNVDTEKLNFDNKFYSFFEEIYNLFEEDLYNLEESSILYKFLIWWWEDNEEKNNNEILEENNISNNSILINFIESDFYKNYLVNLEENWNKIFWKNERWENLFTKNNIKITLDDLVKSLDKSWNNNSETLFKNIWFFISSIVKISEEKAFRDYVLNNLLNFYEALRFYKKIDFKILFEKIKINSKDLDYPAFEDFILYWLPFILFYFREKWLMNKSEVDKIIKKDINNDNSLLINNFNPLLKIHSSKEENILIDVFLNQSINNLNSEWWFDLNFDKIKNNEQEYKKWKKFIETKLNIAFWKIKKSDEIDDDVFEFWRENIIWYFIDITKIYDSILIDNIKKSFLLKYYNSNYKFLERGIYNINNNKKLEWEFKWHFNNVFNLISSDNISENFLILRYWIILNLNPKDLFDNFEELDLKGEYFKYKNLVQNNKGKKFIIEKIIEKINPLDDIKVIKKEWFENFNS